VTFKTRKHRATSRIIMSLKWREEQFDDSNPIRKQITFYQQKEDLVINNYKLNIEKSRNEEKNIAKDIILTYLKF